MRAKRANAAASIQQTSITSAYQDLAVASANANYNFSVGEASAAQTRDTAQNNAQTTHDQTVVAIAPAQQASQWNAMWVYAPVQANAAATWANAVKHAAAYLKQGLNAAQANLVNAVANLVAQNQALNTSIQVSGAVATTTVRQSSAVNQWQATLNMHQSWSLDRFRNVNPIPPQPVLTQMRADANSSRDTSIFGSIEQLGNALTAGQSRAILLSPAFTAALNAIDGFFAGVADSLTAGLSTKLRAAMWGETATQNHTGGWFMLGQGVGAVLSIPLMAANPCSLGVIGNIGLRLINGAQLIGNGINAVQNIMAGNYLSAGLNIIGMLGNLSQLAKACFTGDTKLMARGTWGSGWRRIDQITTNDEVLSRDENDVNGPLAWKKVEELFVRIARTMNLHVRGQLIRTTAEHPFCVYNRGWAAAGELQVGDWFSSHDGQWVQLEDLCDAGEYETVYNMRVADFHTYFVGERHWGFSVWAHNSYSLPRVSGNVRGYYQKLLQNKKITLEELRTVLHPEDVKQILRNLGKKAGTVPHDKAKIIESIQKSLDAAKRAPDDLAKGKITQEQFDSIMNQAAEIIKAQRLSGT